MGLDNRNSQIASAKKDAPEAINPAEAFSYLLSRIPESSIGVKYVIR
jgi:hypothetical protein